MSIYDFYTQFAAVVMLFALLGFFFFAALAFSISYGAIKGLLKCVRP